MHRKILQFFFVMLGPLLVSGCGTSAGDPQVQAEIPPEAKKPQVFQLDGPVDVSLAGLLGQPRAILAGQADELSERIRLQQRKHREGGLSYNLLPDLGLPLAVPIFRTAKYSAKRGLSLATYVNDADHDNDLALHLARYGDTEAALQMADPASAAVRKTIEESRLEKNYPLEWTRLVALHLHLAQSRLATGDEEGGRLIVSLHRQLGQVLGAKARSGLLGATLLSRGRSALSQAAAAWGKTSPELAAQADACLRKWGDIASWMEPYLAGCKKDEFARALKSKADGHALAAKNVARAFDLLGLPLPEEEADSVIACFNADEELAEVLVVYRPSAFLLYPKPEQLGLALEDWGAKAKDLESAASVKRRSYSLGNIGIEVATVPGHTSLGALARIWSTRLAHKKVSVARAAGPISLDESYEQNRLRFAPREKGTKLTIDRPDELRAVANVLPGMEPTEASLEADSSERVVSRFSMRAAPTRHGLPSLGTLGLGFWEQSGAARLEWIGGTKGHALALVWDDEKTRCVLTLPHGKREDARFNLTDNTSSGGMAKRASEVDASDRAARRERIEKSRALARISRVREKVCLGMTEAEVLRVAPAGEGVTQRKIPGGLAWTAEAGAEKASFAELFVRFGPEKAVAEVRVRYQGEAKKVLEEARATYGAPRELAGAWAGVWSDYPKRAPSPSVLHWEDDVTILTCQRDSEGVELTLLDRPSDREDGVLLPPFQCISAGPENVKLGTTKAGLLELWKKSKPAMEGEVLILTPPADGPYSQIQVYCTGAAGRATRIVALHTQKWDANPGEDKLADAVVGAWDKEKSRNGYFRRADMTVANKLQSLTGHDDVYRVCVFWQATDAGPRLYTEWTLVKKAKK